MEKGAVIEPKHKRAVIEPEGIYRILWRGLVRHSLPSRPINPTIGATM